MATDSFTPPYSAERQDFLRNSLSDATKSYQSIAGKMREDRVFSGGVDGSSKLNNDPAVRRAVTDKRQRTRDFRLARREAIRRNDRLGAAMIGEKAASQGFNLHGIGKYGADQRAAAQSLAGNYTATQQGIQGLLSGQGGTPYNGQGSGGNAIPALNRGGSTAPNYGADNTAKSDAATASLRAGFNGVGGQNRFEGPAPTINGLTESAPTIGGNASFTNRSPSPALTASPNLADGDPSFSNLSPSPALLARPESPSAPSDVGGDLENYGDKIAAREDAKNTPLSSQRGDKVLSKTQEARVKKIKREMTSGRHMIDALAEGKFTGRRTSKNKGVLNKYKLNKGKTLSTQLNALDKLQKELDSIIQ